jgi:adenylate kinase
MDFSQDKLGLRHINVGEIIAENKFYEGRDNELDTNILDEDKLLDLMETMLEEAADEGVGIVADFHSCELFPERWFDLVLVLRTSTEVLFDRLTKRGYNDKKRDENMESEIMQVILDEARESYDPQIVHEVPSNTLEEMESNVQRVKQWIDQWIEDHACDAE